MQLERLCIYILMWLCMHIRITPVPGISPKLSCRCTISSVFSRYLQQCKICSIDCQAVRICQLSVVANPSQHVSFLVNNNLSSLFHGNFPVQLFFAWHKLSSRFHSGGSSMRAARRRPMADLRLLPIMLKSGIRGPGRGIFISRFYSSSLAPPHNQVSGEFSWAL